LVLLGVKNIGDLSLKLPTIELHLLTDPSGFNLLIVAVNSGDIAIAKILLKLGFDVNKLCENETPASIAWKNQKKEVLLFLLNANSLFPPNFSVKNASEGIKQFCNISKNLRFAIENENVDQIQRIAKEHPHLKFFYSTKNKSAASYALKLGKVKIYEELVKLDITIGQEDIERVTALLNTDQLEDLHDFHKSQAKGWSEKHLMVLLG
jgi:ankyrin repeat protein